MVEKRERERKEERESERERGRESEWQSMAAAQTFDKAAFLNDTSSF